MISSEDDVARAIIKGGAAHSDIGIPLHRVVRDLDEAQWISGQRPDFPAAGAARAGTIFAVAEGMQHVTLRLSPGDAAAFQRLGGTKAPAFTSGHWVHIVPWDDRFVFVDWVKRAYDAACA